MSFEKNILVTGGAGFIGSHVVRHFVQKYPTYQVINLDALTYAGNLQNLKDIEEANNYKFEEGRIEDEALIRQLFLDHDIDTVIHLAAESHVDRSISDPMAFVKTNVIGTVNLLNVARNAWANSLDNKLFYHISTDEVYGSLEDGKYFLESTAYDPKSPYSASKASSDHFVRAYANTYNLPIIISNCSNNYGPNQFPEKLIPVCIQKIVNNESIPVYGKGLNVRDWLYVLDHVSAIDLIFHKGKVNETYNIGGINEWKNIDLVNALCDIMDRKLNRQSGECAQLITFVTDRAGHDLRYAIDAGKLSNELGWKPSVNFKEGLEKTVDWYLDNQQWIDDIKTGKYQSKYSD